MKLVTFTREGASRIGSLEGQKLVDLNHACTAMLESRGELRAAKIAEAFVPPNMVEFLQGGRRSVEMAAEAVRFALEHEGELRLPAVLRAADVKMEAPVIHPGKIICVGQNYREHILEMGRELPRFPVVFAKFGNAIIGPWDDIPLHPISEQMDYEAELAFVIGKRARHVKEEEALEYVAGYMVANDITYRDIQRRTIQWLQGKTVDGSLPMGPWLVTADEIGDPSGLTIRLEVNGEERQRSNTAQLVFTVPFLVRFLSELVTLEPGDVILTGTPGGVGFARQPRQFLKDGDLVRVEVDKIGFIENRVRKV